MRRFGLSARIVTQPYAQKGEFWDRLLGELRGDGLKDVAGLGKTIGGFLGIGEKEVSITTAEVKRTVHSDGPTYFTINVSKD